MDYLRTRLLVEQSLDQITQHTEPSVAGRVDASAQRMKGRLDKRAIAPILAVETTKAYGIP